ncbi:hypothetical protein ACFVAV_19195 [Nocardia sp. NPDC057663]
MTLTADPGRDLECEVYVWDPEGMWFVDRRSVTVSGGDPTLV